MAETGLYSNIVKGGDAPPPQGTSAGFDVNAKTIEGLVKLRNALWGSILPDGRLKTALLNSSPDLFSIFKTMISLLQGRRYYEQEYKLGERLLDQVQCQSVGWREVPDEIVPIARMVFTQLFGVRITSNLDLDALDVSEDAYFARGGKWDISWEQATRAVMLKRNYYSASTYNVSCWDLRMFDQHPLIGPIPEMNADDHGGDLNLGKLYSGPGFNGQVIENGYIKGVLPPPATTAVPGGNAAQPGTGAATSVINRIISFAKANPLPSAIIGAAVGYAIYELSNDD